MKVFDIAFRHTKEQRAVFESSCSEIYAMNKSTLQSLSFVMTLLGAGIFAASLVMPAFYDVRLVYGAGFAMALTLLILSHKGLHSPMGVLCALYFLFTVLFALAIFLSVGTSPNQRATVLLGFMPLMPLLIIDRSWRVNAFVLIIVGTHGVLSLLFKPWDLPLDDFTNCFVFALLGIYVGNSVRATRLTNFLLQQKAEHMAKQDFLTGLYNRRKMYEVIGESDAGARVICGVILFDIDYFKGFNDHYGHQAGDDCLVRIGDFLTEFTRLHGMTAFRFGGEEFAAFQYSGDSLPLDTLAEALRAGVYACNISYPDREPGRVCISVGYCAATADSTVHQMITAADHALYCAKRAGRNCCRRGMSLADSDAQGACSML